MLPIRAATWASRCSGIAPLQRSFHTPVRLPVLALSRRSPFRNAPQPRTVLLALKSAHAIRPLPSIRAYWWSSTPSTSTTSSAIPSHLPSSPAPQPATDAVAPASSSLSGSPPSSELLSSSPAPASEAPSILEFSPEPFVTDPALISTPLVDAIHAPMHIGDLSSLGLIGWTPASLMRQLMEIVHVGTGLPWWLTIVATVVVIRIAILPLYIKSTINSSRLAIVAPQMNLHREAMTEAIRNGDQAAGQYEQRKMVKVLKDSNASIGFAAAMPVVQMFVSLSMFFGLRKMALLPVPQLMDGGTAWFTDLTMTGQILGHSMLWYAPWTWFAFDSTWILPALAVGAMYAQMKLGPDPSVQQTEWMLHFQNFGAALIAMFFVVCVQNPAAVVIYFVVNSALMLAQSAFITIPVVRRYLGLPIVNTTRAARPSFAESWRAMNEHFYKQAENKRLERMKVIEGQRLKEIQKLAQRHEYSGRFLETKAHEGRIGRSRERRKKGV